jgi:hypothetical protein
VREEMELLMEDLEMVDRRIVEEEEDEDEERKNQ